MVCALGGAKAALYDDVLGHTDYDVTLSAPGVIGSSGARAGFHYTLLFVLCDRRERKCVARSFGRSRAGSLSNF